MPKFKHGILITCESTIRLFIKSIDTENKIIIEELDENHILIDEDYLQEVQIKVEQMQDTNSYIPIKVVNK